MQLLDWKSDLLNICYVILPRKIFATYFQTIVKNFFLFSVPKIKIKIKNCVVKLNFSKFYKISDDANNEKL